MESVVLEQKNRPKVEASNNVDFAEDCTVRRPGDYLVADERDHIGRIEREGVSCFTDTLWWERALLFPRTLPTRWWVAEGRSRDKHLKHG